MARLIPASNVVMNDTCIKTQKSEFRHDIFLPSPRIFVLLELQKELADIKCS